MPTATFKFHGSLNDFLPATRRGAAMEYWFAGGPAIKDAIESIGVPHPEVDSILTNGRPVGFRYRLRPGDRVEVFGLEDRALPDRSGSRGLIPIAPHTRRFVLDGHLGRLARYLRMLGFDALYGNRAGDDELAEASARDERILLTRDRGLLKRSAVRLGYLVRNDDPRRQLDEVVARYGLADLAAPFSRCVRCNGALEHVDRAAVAERLAGEPRTLRYFDTFGRCLDCGAIYWQGSHFDRMSRLVHQVVHDRPAIVDNRPGVDSRMEGDQ
ncbi:MAG: Mut7-C RNAse domain-containing protein [Candidatus Limnocylindrales bacterium]|jgi:hypothetical protein